MEKLAVEAPFLADKCCRAAEPSAPCQPAGELAVSVHTSARVCTCHFAVPALMRFLTLLTAAVLTSACQYRRCEQISFHLT